MTLTGAAVFPATSEPPEQLAVTWPIGPLETLSVACVSTPDSVPDLSGRPYAPSPAWIRR